ncbi:MAG: helix-turn-helix transcriptional regulator [Planctomycetia bacterium]|jgi:LuxR family maltose regulon positive regulatory protein|nr:helix-turn-helix transcriptional regulator [Planctomycetia bacterium]OQY99960.1 MAG: hypothetical protein B6D36_15710 [Planctomycetes bacterium UTPLA1]
MGQRQAIEHCEQNQRQLSLPTSGDDRLPPGAEEAIRELAKRNRLTRRENQIVELICRGLKNGSMAYELGLTMPTVRFHLQNLYKKLGTCDKGEVLLQVWRIATPEATV